MNKCHIKNCQNHLILNISPCKHCQKKYCSLHHCNFSHYCEKYIEMKMRDKIISTHIKVR